MGTLSFFQILIQKCFVGFFTLDGWNGLERTGNKFHRHWLIISSIYSVKTWNIKVRLFPSNLLLRTAASPGPLKIPKSNTHRF